MANLEVRNANSVAGFRKGYDSNLLGDLLGQRDTLSVVDSDRDHPEGSDLLDGEQNVRVDPAFEEIFENFGIAVAHVVDLVLLAFLARRKRLADRLFGRFETRVRWQGKQPEAEFHAPNVLAPAHRFAVGVIPALARFGWQINRVGFVLAVGRAVDVEAAGVIAFWDENHAAFGRAAGSRVDVDAFFRFGIEPITYVLDRTADDAVETTAELIAD